MWKLLSLSSLIVFSICSVLTVDAQFSPAHSQSLNQRNSAPPSANAKKARVLSDARRNAWQSGQGLNRKQVNTDCNPVEIGNQQPNEKGRLSRDEQVVVVPGDIINICR